MKQQKMFSRHQQLKRVAYMQLNETGFTLSDRSGL
jgi:hypothetical protein